MRFNQCSKRTTITLSIISFLLFLTQCGPAKYFQHVEPGYKLQSQTNATVLVIPFIHDVLKLDQRNVLISNKSLQNRPINRKEISLVKNFLPAVFSQHTYAKVVSPDEGYKFENLSFDFDELKDEDRKLSLFVPKIDKPITYKSKSPEYVLFIEDVYFIRGTQDVGLSLGRGSSMHFSFNAGIDYLIWDNKNQKICAFGTIKKDSELFSLPTQAEYLSVLEEFSKTILKESPLKVRKLVF